MAANTLCFFQAYRARYHDKSIGDAEYISHLVAHFDGRRHKGNFGICDETLFEPVAGSIRRLAIEGKYQPVKDTSTFARLFQACLEGQDTVVRQSLTEIETHNPDVVPYQPLAVMAAREGRAEILQLCFDRGVTFDRYLARTALEGSQRFEAIRALTEPYSAIIKENYKARKNSDGMYTDEQLEEMVGDVEW